ncbi:MAG: hypothetical protein P4L59_14685 [Desulfosporosinus sp.]|nr:hypothetical protein [Desulfosporosinus sp.]
MTKSNVGVTQHTNTTEWKVPHGASHIPNVGGKMFRRTSESAGGIH